MHRSSETRQSGLRPDQVVARAALCFALVVGFEALLHLAAVLLFPHLDTPRCAGTDPFCSPGGLPGPTGGTVVVVLGNLVAAAGVAVLMLLARRRAVWTM